MASYLVAVLDAAPSPCLQQTRLCRTLTKISDKKRDPKHIHPSWNPNASMFLYNMDNIVDNNAHNPSFPSLPSSSFWFSMDLPQAFGNH